MRVVAFVVAFAFVLLAPSSRASTSAPGPADSLVIGETFRIASAVLHETRRINVYFPPGFSASSTTPLPVMVMPDGGLGEDFLHVAGLVEVLVGDGVMRPWLLVGIENTERRRDLTGPTEVASDRKIAPRVGGSQAFRDFIRTELLPEVRARYRTTPATGIVGESLAGLFVVETFLREPDLFGTYVAIDPSLWWNDHDLVAHEIPLLAGHGHAGQSLFVAASSEPGILEDAKKFQVALEGAHVPGLDFHYEPFPAEGHGTIYHPAAMRAFRLLLAPASPASGR